MVGFNLILAFCFMSRTVFQTVCIARMAILKKCVICFFSLVIFTEHVSPVSPFIDWSAMVGLLLVVGVFVCCCCFFLDH